MRIGKKQARRLSRRIADWNNLKHSDLLDEKRKMLGKQCFTRPGSNKK